MADVKAKNCDSCGKLHLAEHSTKRTLKYEGDVISGQKTEDLCPDCAQTAQEALTSPLDPLPKAKKQAQTTSH